MTFPGAPCIYYGDEVGLGGGLDPDCRRSFPSESDWNMSLLQSHKALIQLRHSLPALRTGAYKTVLAEGTLYGFIRQTEDQTILILVNSGQTEASGIVSTEWFSTDSWTIQYGEGQCNHETTHLRVTLPPLNGVVIKDD